MTTPTQMPDLDPDPDPDRDLTPVIAEIGRQLHALDLRALTPRHALDLLGVLLRIRGREAGR